MSTAQQKRQKQTAALTAINGGMAIRKAGKLSGVCESTLRGILKRGYMSDVGRLRNKCIFNKEEEHFLANQFVKIASQGHGLSTRLMEEMGKDLAKSLGLTRLPTQEWVRSFRKRHNLEAYNLKAIKEQKKDSSILVKWIDGGE